MKKYWGLLLLVFVIFYIAYTSAMEDVQIIYIDAGHGGDDSGASMNGIDEDELNLAIALNVAERLTFIGYKVLLTRTGDYDLAPVNSVNRKRDDIHKRVKLINESKCSMYVSIHANAIHSPVWRGAQVFYKDGNENAKIGEIMQDSLTSTLKNTDRVSKPISGKYLVDNIKKPGALVEVGFISNPEEAALLKTKEYQGLVSYAIFIGIIDYLNK